jgi:drug/metabolite transporter (DMT)-like permease
MTHRTSSRGLLVALVAATSFGVSGALVKPLLEGGWSPAAAVTVRALVGGLALTPFALLALRGRFGVLWTARWRILGMAVIGVVGTQVFYFAAVRRIPVGTAILIEYMAPLLLVAVAWVVTRRRPAATVLVGAVVAAGGLVLVVSPGGGGRLDPVGLASAAVAMVCCAAYFVIAARPPHGLPSVALACAGLLVATLVLAVVGLTGLVPYTASAAPVELFGATAPWWVPLLAVGVIATAVSYAASIAATAMLGSRLASFVGLLEVAAAALWAWLLLGESLTLVQGLGGLAILVGIAFVRSDPGGPPEDVVAETVPAPASTGRSPAVAPPGASVER